MELISVDSLTESEKSYGANNVVRIDPVEGSLYEQGEDNSIILYYYQ